MTVPKNPPRTGRPLGSLGHTPGKRQINNYRRQLRMKADAGNTLALGFLVLAETLREQQGER